MVSFGFGFGVVGFFPLGKVVFSRSVAILSEENGFFQPLEYLKRHFQGDWGESCLEDKIANEEAIRDGSRILSVYDIYPYSGESLYIITEHDRSMTTLLLASEY